MAYLIVIIAILVGSLASLIFWSLYMGAKRDVDDLQVRLDTSLAAGTASRLGAEDAVHRLERVVASLKAEVASLEKDLGACRDVSVVRDRLRRLLSNTEAGVSGGDGAGASSGVPPAAAPK